MKEWRYDMFNKRKNAQAYMYLRLYGIFMFSRLFIAALWSPVGKGLTSWLLFVICHFPMWYPGSRVVLD